MNVKNKLNMGKKGGVDVMTVGGLAVFVVVLAVMLWYYTQPTPPELFVTKLTSSLDESDCSAVVKGEVFNNGGTAATGVSVQCNAGYGSLRPNYGTISEVGSKKSVEFEIKVPLKSCSEAISEDCKIAGCSNCK